MNALDVIRARMAATEPDPDVQAVVAATLTLMTAYVHASSGAERAAAAATIAANLQDLAEREELTDEFRHLCGRLQLIWSETASTA
jgi:hypothetical protein